MDQGGRRLRAALQAYLDATEAELGQSWLSTASHTREERTRKGYAAAVNPCECLKLEITEMVAGDNAEGSLKKVLCGCRHLDKLPLHPRIVEPGDWQVVRWLAKR